MKKVIFLLCLLISAGSIAAQQVKYKLIHDNPPTPRLNINLEYFNIDVGVNNLDGMSFNIGSFGYFEPTPGIGLQYNFKKSIFTFGKLGNEGLPGNLDLSAGGYLFFQNKVVKKPTKVVLKNEYKGTTYSTNWKGEMVKTTHEEVTFMTIPAQRRIMRGLRAGYYMKRGPFGGDFEGDVPFSTSTPLGLTSIGVYAGVTMRSIKNVFIDTPDYGVQFNSIGDDFVLDLLIVPVNIFRDPNNETAPNVSEAVRESLGSNPFGLRIGWYRSQIEKKAVTGKKFGMAAGFEAGFKPYQGLFFNGSLGITIIKN
jgi:hypothetical protein